MSTFCVGLSAVFICGDGKPTFPSCDWSGFKADKVEVEQMVSGNMFSQN